MIPAGPPILIQRRQPHCEDSMNVAGHNLPVEAPNRAVIQIQMQTPDSSRFDFSLTFMCSLKHTPVELQSFLDSITDWHQVLAEIGR